VKELVENAVDAGASRVEVALELGGTRRITVTDDGCGMAEDDARLALRRHTTSKIKGADDLFRIETMGFRGEALAAIASVSRLTLATREIGSNVGVKLANASGEGFLALPWNGPEGTTISVEQLFYNVPVRAKFLKSPATELGHVHELMQALALCHPHVSFVLTHNGRELLRAPAVSGDPASEAVLRGRVRAVLGSDVEPKLLYLRQSNRFGSIAALVSPPGVEKPTAKQVHAFVNGRPVKDRVVRFGILRGYHSHLMKGRHPVAVLHLTTDPALVDVNVHPAKTEVRFQYPDEVQSLISLAIRERLRDASWAAPEAPAEAVAESLPESLLESSPELLPELPRAGAFRAREDEAPRGGATREASERRLWSPSSPRSTTSGASVTTRWSARAPSDGASLDAGGLAPVRDAQSLDALLRGPQPAAAPAPTRSVVPWDDLRLVGAFDRCYLFFEMPGQLLVLDQHAFHERILYERLLRDEGLLRRSQPLLVPESIELDAEACARVAANVATLAERGFAVTIDGPTTVTLNAVPVILARADLTRLLSELAARLPETTLDASASEAARELQTPLLATFACHAAVRAGEELGDDELKRLLAEARTVDFYHNCPHGRRVFRWFPRDAVAAWFDR
jgi:DNA mismatch repair protein MutL